MNDVNSLFLRHLRVLLPFVSGLRWRYAAGACLLLLTNALAMFIPWLMKIAVEGLKDPATAGLSPSLCAVAIAAISVIHCLVRILSRTAILHSARIIEFRIREALFERILLLDIPFHTRERTGDILSKFSNDLTNVRMLTGFGIMSILNTAIVYSMVIFLMLRLSPWLTVVAVAPLPLMILCVRSVSSRIFNLSREVQEELSSLSSLAEESVSAVRLIKSYCRESYFTGSFGAGSDRCMDKNLSLARLRALVAPVMAMATGAGVLAVLFVGGKQVIEGSMTLGDFVAFAGYLAMLVWPTAVIGWVITLFQRGAASMVRIDGLLASRPEIADKQGVQDISGIGSGLSAMALSFGFGDIRVLDGLDFNIGKGEKIGITGPVGSGKSTLLRILARLLPVDDGMLYMDGKDLNSLSIGSVRSIIGYMPQESFLFSRSIGDNILYGGGTEPETLAMRAGLKEEISGFADGMAARVGERGVTLSGGQRQRVALARALAGDPEILLLDDPLASVDAGREDEILSSLESLWGEKTVVMVSQRLSAFRGCSRVMVLEGGRIVENGEPETLMGLGGRYAALARLQGVQADQAVRKVL